MSKKHFDECNHIWKFHIDSDKSGPPGQKPWCSFFWCNICENQITLLEKCALDRVSAQSKSLNVQEKHTKNGMIANFISAFLMIIAVLALLWGQGVLLP